MPPTSSLCFATCQVGAHQAMKLDVAGRHPDWKFAFSRPGFVSWKLPSPASLPVAAPSVLAHAHGLAIGRGTPADAPRTLAQCLAGWETNAPFRLHCRARAVSPTREILNPLEPIAASLHAALLDTGNFHPEAEARPGDRVVDVLVVDAESLVFGVHDHGPGHSPFPGGMPPLVLPEMAPSRAWLKAEEAMLWHPRGPVRTGQTVVEIGSAPGGTAMALADRGAEVICVDPADLDPQVRARHVRKPAMAVVPGDLPPSFDWLFIDINDNPGSTMRLAARFLGFSTTRPSLVLTLKTSDWSAVAALPDYRKKLARLGYRDVQARQLWHGRREIVLLA